MIPITPDERALYWLCFSLVCALVGGVLYWLERKGAKDED
jgi:hypothetical protein